MFYLSFLSFPSLLKFGKIKGNISVYILCRERVNRDSIAISTRPKCKYSGAQRSSSLERERGN